MTNTDIAVPTAAEQAALVMRVALGILYVSHALLMWTISGADLIAAGEVVGGVMLLLGFHTRAAAVGLFPVAIAAALMHAATGPGMGLAYYVYLAGCLAAQAILASGLLARASILEDLSR
jgi:putative oxidoreductase